METVKKVNSLFNKYLVLFVVGVAAIALWVPQTFTWASNYTSFFLQVIMFGMGMTMTLGDFSEVLKTPGKVLLVSAMQFGFMPLSAFLIAKLFNLPDDMALGLILVGCVPGGTSSNVITYLSNGNAPLSITATSVSTLLAPLVTPLLLSFYGSAYVEISFWAMFLSIFQIVLVPIVAGVVVNYLLGRHIDTVKEFLPTVSTLGILLVLGGTVSVNAETLMTSGLVMFLAVTLHNMSGYLFGHGVSYLVKMDEGSTRAMSIEVAMQNTGLAASLGLTHFNPAAALAGAVGAIMHNVVGIVYSNICQYRDKTEATVLEQPVAKSAEQIS